MNQYFAVIGDANFGSSQGLANRANAGRPLQTDEARTTVFRLSADLANEHVEAR
jgi:hypothetical protein